MWEMGREGKCYPAPIGTIFNGLIDDVAGPNSERTYGPMFLRIEEMKFPLTVTSHWSKLCPIHISCLVFPGCSWKLEQESRVLWYRKEIGNFVLL